MHRGTDNHRRYEQWVDRWADDLYRFAVRLCGHRDLADDLVQETFFHAWRSIETLRDEGRARAWLFQILRHRWSNTVRTSGRRPDTRTSIDSVVEPTSAAPSDPLEAMAREEIIRRGMAQLSEEHRVVLLMVFVEGLTCQEAADELNVPLGTVLSRIHRARKAMRTHLTELERSGQTTGARDGEDAPPPLRLGGAS